MQIIAHLDMDSFFASIEERANPQFVGLGIVVGADPKNGTGRGVVSTANYLARKYGIHSAMPITNAWRLAQGAIKRGEPKTVFLPVNGSYYSQVSDRIFELVRKYVPVVEQTSIDEAYLDLSFCLYDNQSYNFMTNTGDRLHLSSKGIEKGYDSAFVLIKKIKEEIKKQEKLTAKAGIAPNKLIAKIASSQSPAGGLVVVKPDEAEGFLDPLPIGDIPGIGPKTEEFFHKKRIFKVADLKKISKEEFKAWMGPPATRSYAMRAGKWGEEIYLKARGIDNSQVVVEREIKSVSEQETFEKDTLSPAFILGRLDKLATRVIERMKEEEISHFKTVTIIVRFADFTTKNRSHTLKSSTNSLSVFKNEAIKLLLPFLDRRENPNLKKIRLIGAGIENFTEENQKPKTQTDSFVQENLFKKVFLLVFLGF